MRATQFIHEAEVEPYERETLTLKKAIATLKQHCSQSESMIIHNDPLWRGMNNHSEEIVNIWPETGLRKSQNTSDHYTQLMSNSPYMRGFPQRNKSVICSSSSAIANGYGGGPMRGNTYAIIPYDHVEIGVCPTSDLWDIRVNIPEFKQNIEMSQFNDWLIDKFNLPPSFAGMQAALNNPESEEYKMAVRRCEQINNKLRPEDLIEVFFKALSPENLGLRLMTAAEYTTAGLQKNECWVSGPCVAIRASIWEKVVREYNK